MPDGYYFTSDIDDANRYAKQEEGSNVMPVYLHIRFPFDVNKKNKISNEMVMQFRDELRAENPNLGFDWIQGKVKNFKELEKMWWTNRKAMYGKYYYMFESYSPNAAYYRNLTGNRII